MLSLLTIIPWRNLLIMRQAKIPKNWTNIWKLRVLQKIKIFLMDDCSKMHPHSTKQRLHLKGVQCLGNKENGWHIFFERENEK